MIRLHCAFIDGSVVDESFPNHEIDTVELMIKETEESLLVMVEIEDAKGKITRYYKREQKHGY